MAEVSFSKLPRAVAILLLANQRLYSPAQVDMAKNARVLMWVRPPNLRLPRGVRLKVFGLKSPNCVYCGCGMTTKTFTVDAIDPVVLGSKHELGNLTVACRPRKSTKGASPWAF